MPFFNMKQFVTEPFLRHNLSVDYCNNAMFLCGKPSQKDFMFIFELTHLKGILRSRRADVSTASRRKASLLGRITKLHQINWLTSTSPNENFPSMVWSITNGGFFRSRETLFPNSLKFIAIKILESETI
jgi:hypothetical protein